MSYVQETRRTNSLGMGAAILVNGSIILAVALSPIIAERVPIPTIIQGTNIPEQKPVKKDPKPDDNVAKPIKPIFAPDPIIETKTPPDLGPSTTNEWTDIGSIGTTAGGDDEAGSTLGNIPKIPMPIFKAALRDPRFARAFQPEYPVGKLRLEIEGSVTVRILVGTDGRVRQVQILNATDPDFARATEKQALKAWRFKPATRDGVPVEDWQTLTVRFDIN
ncbi:energy transducer TonB [Sphingorhabdus lacus]|uniref:Protein TonB n=1 Tax=Sphingorhabdus lacus TaxID=392610 RepID=A0A6I6LBM4_9SPHN|nr:energy transducer TonB [Sphingorhabdus lacus]QGY81436.1 energy transducer TonB [Sphingorhabdus lacus]